jgi:hypothetical protein
VTALRRRLSQKPFRRPRPSRWRRESHPSDVFDCLRLASRTSGSGGVVAAPGRSRVPESGCAVSWCVENLSRGKRKISCLRGHSYLFVVVWLQTNASGLIRATVASRAFLLETFLPARRARHPQISSKISSFHSIFFASIKLIASQQDDF